MKPKINTKDLMSSLLVAVPAESDNHNLDTETSTKESFTGETSGLSILGHKAIPAVGVLDKVVNTQGSSQQAPERLWVQKLDPKRCKPWKYHDRMDESVIPEKIESLTESIRIEGQRDPGLVRKLEGDAEFDYEIIYGRCRHASCLIIDDEEPEGFFFKAVVKEVKSNQDAAYWTWIENEENTPITDFERGVYFRKLLGKVDGFDAVFNSQEELSKRFNRDKGKVSKLVQCASLLDFADIMNAVPNRAEIPFTYGHKLVGLLADKKKAALIIKEAKNQTKLKASKTTLSVIKALLDSVSPVKPTAETPKYFGNKENPELLTCQTDKQGRVTIKVDRNAKELGASKLKAIFDQLVKDVF